MKKNNKDSLNIPAQVQSLVEQMGFEEAQKKVLDETDVSALAAGALIVEKLKAKQSKDAAPDTSKNQKGKISRSPDNITFLRGRSPKS